MKKRVRNIIFLSALIILLAGIIFVIAPTSSNPEIYGHSADNIFITMNGFPMTLQYAIDNNYFNLANSPAAQSSTPANLNGHSANEISVSVNGNTKTLQQAIDSLRDTTTPEVSAFCLNTLISSSNTEHSLEEININIAGTTKKLQQAIDENNLCCNSNFRQACGATDCIIGGVYDCAGICTGTLKKEVGTLCTIDGTSNKCFKCTVNGICETDTNCVAGELSTMGSSISHTISQMKTSIPSFHF